MRLRGADGSTPVTLVLVGAGNRGASVYGDYALRHPREARVVALADPDTAKRERVAAAHGVPAERAYRDWSALLAAGRLADAAVIATPDALHPAAVKAALAAGYEVLLEKPIAPDLAGVLDVVAAARDARGSVTVSHVLRYTSFFQALKSLIDGGRIGHLTHIQHTENIGYWHYAHSYVRGNWRRESDASPMILAKACHDLDLIRWLVGKPCERLSSFGELSHFRTDNAPVGSTERCLDGCAVERECPYSAPRIYLERFGGAPGWPNEVLTEAPDEHSVRRALETGPYGRCVYRCDNDAIDNQTVALRFEGGVSASLTVSAFTERNTRTVHVMGSHGEIRGDLELGELEVKDFATGRTEMVRTVAGSGHVDGDDALMRDFLERTRGGEGGVGLTDLGVSVESHLMAFAAERARRGGVGVAPSEL